MILKLHSKKKYILLYQKEIGIIKWKDLEIGIQEELDERYELLEPLIEKEILDKEDFYDNWKE